MTPELLKVIVVIAVVGVVELIKKLVFKDDPKYKLLYTVAPIVLCAIAYFIIALIQKTDIWAGIVAGGTLGLTCMGSFDLIANILKQWWNKTPNEIVKEVGEVIGTNPKQVEKK